MKQLLLLTIAFISLSASAQKKTGGYFSVRGGAGFDDGTTKGLAHLSVGVSSNNVFGFGGGIGFIQFEKPYIPITADISFFGNPEKISPVVIGSAGYGVYNYSNAYTKVGGGFTGSINVGVSFPGYKKSKLFLTGGYSLFSFDIEGNTATTGNDIKSESSIKMVTVTIGFKM